MPQSHPAEDRNVLRFAMRKTGLPHPFVRTYENGLAPLITDLQDRVYACVVRRPESANAIVRSRAR